MGERLPPDYGGFHSCRYAELQEDGRHVGLHRAFGDKEFPTDLAIRPSPHERCKDLHLPRREGRS